MAAVLARMPSPSKPSTPPPALQTHPLMLNTSLRGTPAAIPNKHLPVCSPGPQPQIKSDSPTATSPTGSPAVLETHSLLYPPTAYKRLLNQPPVYALNARQFHAALIYTATQPLPDPKLVFPWLHGLHADNNLQLAFFIARKRALRRQPRCIRGITVVKVGGDLSCSKIRGAISADELLHPDSPQFFDSDPKDGFSVRNFQIQASKMASVSDIVVYRDDNTSKAEVEALAQRLAHAQRAWREKDKTSGTDRPVFNTFVVTESFSVIEEHYPDIVAVASNNCLTGNVLDFFHSERVEMQAMSQASEIAHNIWLGPSPDLDFDDPLSRGRDQPLSYDIMIECNDMAQAPNKNAFKLLEEILASTKIAKTRIPQLEFPASGSIMPTTWSQVEADSLLNTISWIYRQANGIADHTTAGAEPSRQRKDSKVSFPERDDDGDSTMGDYHSVAPKRKFLLHCSDGYTETTLLATAYYMYANCVPLHQAYLELHCKHKRNFFSYPTDMSLLTTVQPRLLQASPLARIGSFSDLSPPTPAWMTNVDGSLPSRIMPYMYLGNLNHANNPGLLREMGIGQVLSIGETVDWTDADKHSFCQEGEATDSEPLDCDGDGKGKWMFIGGVQDNGVDPLTDEFSRCLEFIRKGRDAGVATLVHCRVGVSRSATICIAEVMNELGYSFPKAYCFVRARRLNVIIQPHLRFSYELLKYEEFQAAKRGVPFKRELEWATIAREIAAMNRPYSR